MRSGTVPTPLVVGLGAACELAQQEMQVASSPGGRVKHWRGLVRARRLAVLWSTCSVYLLCSARLQTVVCDRSRCRCSFSESSSLPIIYFCITAVLQYIKLKTFIKMSKYCRCIPKQCDLRQGYSPRLTESLFALVSVRSRPNLTSFRPSFPKYHTERVPRDQERRSAPHLPR